MKAYINNCASINPQGNFTNDDFFGNPLVLPISEDGRLHAVEPDYKPVITDANLRRRMSRIIKMGVSASLKCYVPDENIQFITATAMGNMTDTERFLTCVIGNNETLLNPTYFIQSTGNTFGGQTGLLVHSHGYNVTYVHGGFSFESALLDALMKIDDGDLAHVVVTAADEITPAEYDVMNRMGFFRGGQLMGEGANAFLLSAEADENTLCSVCGVKSLRKPEQKNFESALDDLLKENNLNIEDIDFLLTGTDRDVNLRDCLTKKIPNTADYKQWCGHYMTASSFGMFMGANMIKRQQIIVNNQWQNKPIRNILLYTEFQQNDYTLILLRK